jgi:dimethylhistidine N-methyltransferase
MSPAGTATRLPEIQSDLEDEFTSAVIAGLSKAKKSLPCRFFYDARGSELFEEITRLPEYYPTRTETGIIAAHAAEMVEAMPENSVLVEFGSGSSRKTELVLERLAPDVAYVPIDVSESALEDAASRLAQRFPALDVRPIIGDFSRPLTLPPDLARRPNTGFFPGSTIGNLAPKEAARLLGVFKSVLSPGGRLIIGVDLKKDARKLVLAYNDASCVTAAFNLNLLARINREIEPAFDLSSFRHEAIYDPREGRIEMHLVSKYAQEVAIRGRRFKFRLDETIHTENSYKYSIEQFQELARSAGWWPAGVWTDDDHDFSVHNLASL